MDQSAHFSEEIYRKMAEKKPEEYAKFWKQFGQVLKEGPAEDANNREAIAKLFRDDANWDRFVDRRHSIDEPLVVALVAHEVHL